MADPSEFRRRMKRLGKRVADNADRLVRKCALAVDATVVMATPVDTGRARSNWQVELNQRAEGTIGPYSPGEGGSSAAANSQAAIEQGKRVIARYKGGAGAAIHITNNLPYIKKLNEGWSAQAPAGFVEDAVIAGVAAIKNSKITIGRVELE